MTKVLCKLSCGNANFYAHHFQNKHNRDNKGDKIGKVCDADLKSKFVHDTIALNTSPIHIKRLHMVVIIGLVLSEQL